MDFYDLDLDDKVLDALDAMRFEECTPIQEKTIPPILEGHDVMGIAQTGTGKTAAYLLPIINQLYVGDYSKSSINCIVMSPTRELAQQIDQAMEGFSYFVPVSSVAVYGGNDGIRYEQESRSLRLGADMIIATPGRLLAHIQLEHPDFSKVKFFVLDEADRMLDMGFYDDIININKLLPEDCQKVMFSATMPEKIKQLANGILHNPVEVKIAVSKPAESIRQRVCFCADTQKSAVIRDLFQKNKDLSRVIIFSSSKRMVKQLAIELAGMHINVAQMHSDLDQAQRDETMMKFRNNHVSVLVATDIISRGIDIDDIELVINYDVPADPEDYIHRIGRTARAGRGGASLTLVCGKDRQRFRNIEKLMEKRVDIYPLPEGMETVREKSEPNRPRGEKRNYKPRRNNHRPNDDSRKPNDKGRRPHRDNRNRRNNRRNGNTLNDSKKNDA